VVGELDIYGVYFRAFAVFAAIVFVLQLAVKRLLDAHGIYRFVWHRALFDLELYVILLGVVTAAAARILHLREGADVKIGCDDEHFCLSRACAAHARPGAGGDCCRLAALELLIEEEGRQPWLRSGRSRDLQRRPVHSSCAHDSS
jgi:hypothetical protein